jgi:hypothetical protein
LIRNLTPGLGYNVSNLGSLSGNITLDRSGGHDLFIATMTGGTNVRIIRSNWKDNDGCILEYQPTPSSGVFPLLLDFSTNGEVNIRSDVANNDGEFFNHTITYRIDNALNLELIFDTYGVFHYLFEQNQSSFGAEFQFFYVGKDGNNLIFQSKSDLSLPTQIVFRPASGNEENSFAREVSANLNSFPGELTQQFQLIDQGISIFLNLNSAQRVVQVNTGAVGLTIQDIVANDISTVIDQTVGYTLINGSIIFISPVEFVLDGRFYSIEQVFLNDYDPDGTAGFCSLSPVTLPQYAGGIPGLGDVNLIPTVFDPLGADFQPMPDQPYAVNIPFIFDGDGFSLANEGAIINERFPEATGFVFYYGNQTAGEPEYAAGFFLDTESGESEIFTREFLPTTTTDGNKVTIEFTNNFFHTGTPGPTDEADLTEITDLIFEGTELFAQDFPVQGLRVFILYNPCNNYQVYLVQ